MMTEFLVSLTKKVQPLMFLYIYYKVKKRSDTVLRKSMPPLQFIKIKTKQNRKILKKLDFFIISCSLKENQLFTLEIINIYICTLFQAVNLLPG